MELNGSQHIRRGQEQVWAALNDPAVLQRCIPGCESFEAEGQDRYQLTMAVVVGPVKARFKGRLKLSDVQAPANYTMTFEGSGGAAGFGKGTAHVNLSPAGEGTDLAYSAQAQVGGKLAQVGARLIDGVAARMAAEFFARFRQEIEPDGGEGDVQGPGGAGDAAPGRVHPDGQAAAGTTGPPAAPARARRLWWAAGLAALAACVGWLLYG